MTVTITLGGLIIGLALIIRQFLPAAWHTVMKKTGRPGGDHGQHGHGGGKFNVREHVPFLLGSTLGMLAISCPGGILGWAASKIVQGSNKAGDAALTGGTGSHSTAVTHHATTALNQYGMAATLLLVVAVVVLRKILDKTHKQQMFAGVWCGSTLGLTALATGILGTVLIPAANQLGQFLGGQA